MPDRETVLVVGVGTFAPSPGSPTTDAILDAIETSLSATISVPIDGLDAPPVERDHFEDRYFDTADLRLARWGCAIRHRATWGWTVTIPRPTKSGPHEVEDVEVAGRSAATPPAAARRLVGSLTRGAPVTFVATASIDRNRRRWVVPPDRTVLEVIDDHVAVSALTPATRDRRVRDVVVRHEAAVTGTSIVPLPPEARVAVTESRIARLLGGDASLPPDVVEEPVEDRRSARSVIRAAIARSAGQLLVNIPAARLGVDPEGVHQARVATRRLRSDLRTFRPLLDREWADALRDELKRLGDALGRVRDADVLSILLADTLAVTPQIDAEVGARILAVLDRQRTAHHAALLALLDHSSTVAVYDRVVDAADDPHTIDRALGRAHRRLQPLVRRPWERLRRAADRLGTDPPTEDLHRVRLLAKRARYAAEATASAFGGESDRFASAVAEIQDVLGELNDAAAATAWLSAAAGELDVEAAIAAEHLTKILDAASAWHRHGWERAYRRACRRKNLAWLD